MTTVGIFTLTGERNFGNRLQNFALQEALKAAGVEEVETIRSLGRTGEGGSSIARRSERLRREGPKSITRWIDRRFGRPAKASPSTDRLGAGRERAIGSFVTERLRESTRNYSSTEEAKELAADYDFFIVGSDQVWNPQFGLLDHLRFLEFANTDQRIAYAASFGVSSIPRHLERAYRSGIVGMADVSVREQRAAELVRELAGREAPVVLDPTMLLEPAEWESLAVVAPSLAEGDGYVAEFFLGSATDDEILPVRQLAASRGLYRLGRVS